MKLISKKKIMECDVDIVGEKSETRLNLKTWNDFEEYIAATVATAVL